MTKIVNIKKEKYDVYIGRSNDPTKGYFGNPFSLSYFNYNRKQCLTWYAHYFLGRMLIDEYFRKKVEDLKDKTLGCFCKPLLCHGDIIATYLDTNNYKEKLEKIHQLFK